MIRADEKRIKSFFVILSLLENHFIFWELNTMKLGYQIISIYPDEISRGFVSR